ncbi:MAG TPA: TetR/AcrR family transcriptional regulator [Anaerolineae bacterium]|nr:TetR/AcrR family transcriptional regulator [Anaerolineae bacterium]
MELSDWTQIHTYILHLEQEGLVTRTFRRLDPERQQMILDAILDEAVEKGPTALNIKQVAERAGVSVGSLYTYFPNREGMLAFAIQVCVRIVTDAFDEFRPLLLAMPLREALAAYLVGGIEWSRMYTGLLRLFARAAYHGDPELADTLVRPIATVLRELVRDMLIQAGERGEIRQDVDLEATARLVHALTIAADDSQLLPYLNTYFQVVNERVAPERMVEALISLVLHGIGTEETGENDPSRFSQEGQNDDMEDTR